MRGKGTGDEGYDDRRSVSRVQTIFGKRGRSGKGAHRGRRGRRGRRGWEDLVVPPVLVTGIDAAKKR